MENFNQQPPGNPLSSKGSLEPQLPAGTRPGLSLGLKGLSRLQIQVNLQASPFPAIRVPGPHTVLPQDHSSVCARNLACSSAPSSSC